MNKYQRILDDFINGNISDAMISVNHLQKIDLLNLIEYMHEYGEGTWEANISKVRNALLACKK